MDAASLVPAQLEVLHGLMAWGEPRPQFDRDLPIRLRDSLERALAPVVEPLDGDLPFVTKDRLAQVHACEAHFAAEEQGAFAWNARTARGSVVHKALELSVAARTEAAPMELVDYAIESLIDDERQSSPRPWLIEASALELADLRGHANDVVAKFLECWPPLVPRWSPRAETGIAADLCAGRVTLWGKVDLVVGRAEGTTARSLVVDLKTGKPYSHHFDDLRFYALVQTLRVGVPPFRIASYYLDYARFHHEDVTDDLLETAVRRVADGVTKIAEVTLAGRDPRVTEGPRCAWCRAHDDCEGAARWRAAQAEFG